MSTDPIVWETAKHIAELIAAHGIVEAAAGPAKRGAAKVVDWLHRHLSEADRPKIAAVQNAPASEPDKMALALQVNGLLTAQPSLPPELQALLAEARSEDSSMEMKLGDNSKAVQNRRDNNKISIG